jgi:hypothetical protein
MAGCPSLANQVRLWTMFARETSAERGLCKSAKQPYESKNRSFGTTA